MSDKIVRFFHKFSENVNFTNFFFQSARKNIVLIATRIEKTTVHCFCQKRKKEKKRMGSFLLNEEEANELVHFPQFPVKKEQ